MGGRSKAVLIGVLVFAMACPGCGLLMNGRKQKITINSNPAGAKVRIPTAGIETVTPDVVQLPRKDDHTIFIEKEGYEPRAVQVTSGFEPLATIVDIILFAAIFPLLVDWILGSMQELSPPAVNVTLSKK